MMQVPWILGTLGNNRATLVTGNGAAFYNNTYIRAENWGAVSNDFAGTLSTATAHIPWGIQSFDLAAQSLTSRTTD